MTTEPKRYVPTVTPPTNGWSVGQCRAFAAQHQAWASEQHRRMHADGLGRLQYRRDPAGYRAGIRHHVEMVRRWREAEQRAVKRLATDKARALRDRLTYGEWSDRWQTVYLDGRPVATIEARRVYDRDSVPYQVHATDGALILARHLPPLRIDIARALIQAGRA